MASKKQPESAPGGRQAAYVARNRAALIKSAQEILAEFGPHVTVEELARYAQVSPTTLYKYFPSKEDLFKEALDQMWRDWVVWAYNGVAEGESLEAVISTARKLFWIKRTHPFFAKILHNTLENPTFVIGAVKADGLKVFKNLAKRGELVESDFDKRATLMAYSLAGLMTCVFVTGELSPAQAEVALGIALSLWGLSDAKAKKIMAKPLVFAPVAD
jgi:AcrR family transcriptional regulator